MSGDFFGEAEEEKFEDWVVGERAFLSTSSNLFNISWSLRWAMGISVIKPVSEQRHQQEHKEVSWLLSQSRKSVVFSLLFVHWLLCERTCFHNQHGIYGLIDYFLDINV
jgi:hypothetical protein